MFWPPIATYWVVIRQFKSLWSRVAFARWSLTRGRLYNISGKAVVKGSGR